MTDFIERELVVSKNEPDDGWMGNKPRPKYWMAAHNYAWDYVEHINKDAILWNQKHGTDTLRCSTISVNWHMDIDLTKDRSWGRYCVCDSRTWRAIIKIDIYAHDDNWEEIKHTIRHELTHAIDHQIMGNTWLDHCDAWKKIARLHNVRTIHYSHEGAININL